MRHYFPIIALLIIAIALPMIILSLPHQQSTQNYAASPLSFDPSQGLTKLDSFNDSMPQCVYQGYEYWPAPYGSFASTYQYLPQYWKDCQAEYFSDFTFLSQNGVQILRIWPLLSTFAYNANTDSWGSLNSDISNLDAVLTKLAKVNMKVYITLMSTPACDGSPMGYYFNPKLVTNQMTQNNFINALQQFITRYKNNTTIAGYDLVNEMTNVTANPHSYCGVDFDPKGTQLRPFIQRIITTAKSIDAMHPMTFSTDKPYAETSQSMQAFKNFVDYYDVHFYTDNPNTDYQNFPSYSKSVIQGEVGRTYPDTCDGDYYDWKTQMSTSCQQKFQQNAQDFLTQAKNHHVKLIFFHQWPTSKRYGIRVSDMNGNYYGHTMNLAGQYLLQNNL